MSTLRDRWLAAGLVLLLILLTGAAALQQSQEDEPQPYTVASASPDGARALMLWLSELGYKANADPQASFRVPPDVGVVLLLEPVLSVSPQEWEVLDSWVEEGGTLIIAGSGFASALTFPHFDLRLARLRTPVTSLRPLGPLLRSPPLTKPANVLPRASFSIDQGDPLPILTVEGKPVVVELRRGAGQVFLSSTAHPFTNEGLREEGNGALVLSLISSAREVGAIWFDEWHHGIRADQLSITGPDSWLRHTPAGRAVLYSAGVIFIVLALRGRHFGRPEPFPGHGTRRGPLEHITAIANLSRRAHHRSAVLQQYRHELKRSLGHPFRLDPKLPDDEYAHRLAQMLPSMDAAELRALLTQLQEPNVSERKMIELASAASRWAAKT